MVILQNCTGTIIHIFIFLNIIGEPQMKTGIIDAFGENCIRELQGVANIRLRDIPTYIGTRFMNGHK